MGQLKVFVNDLSPNANRIAFEIQDNSKNRDAIGAVVTVHHGETAQMRELQMSGGFHSFDAPVLHFGLGDTPSVDYVQIQWPDGTTNRVDGPLEAGHRYVIRRP